MVNINIEIPEDLHKKIKMKAVEKYTTIRELIINILEEDNKKNRIQ
jgi:hypothetical protein